MKAKEVFLCTGCDDVYESKEDVDCLCEYENDSDYLIECFQCPICHGLHPEQVDAENCCVEKH